MTEKMEEKKAVEGFYDSHYSRLALTEHMGARLDLTSKYFRQFVRTENPSVLEIGCGTGDNLKRLNLGPLAKLYGVEISLNAVDEASSKGVNAIQVDVNEEDLPVETETMDAVIFEEVIEHLYNSDRV